MRYFFVTFSAYYMRAASYHLGILWSVKPPFRPTCILSIDIIRPLLPLLFGIAFHLQLVLLSCHSIFLRPYHFLKLVSFLGANRTKSASVCLWLLRGAI